MFSYQFGQRVGKEFMHFDCNDTFAVSVFMIVYWEVLTGVAIWAVISFLKFGKCLWKDISWFGIVFESSLFGED